MLTKYLQNGTEEALLLPLWCFVGWEGASSTPLNRGEFLLFFYFSFLPLSFYPLVERNLSITFISTKSDSYSRLVVAPFKGHFRDSSKAWAMMHRTVSLFSTQSDSLSWLTVSPETESTLDSYQLCDSSKTCGGIRQALIGLVHDAQSPDRPLGRTQQFNNDRSPTMPPQRKRQRASHCHGFSDTHGDKLGFSVRSFPCVVPGQSVVSYWVFRTRRFCNSFGPQWLLYIGFC